MADYNLNKMSRKELLELLLQQIDDNEAMRQQLEAVDAEMLALQEDCERQLADRQIELSKAGTMAEAALRLNKVFADADLAVQQYQENIKRYSLNAEAMAASLKEDAAREAGEILASARSEAERTLANAHASVQSALNEAKQEAETIVADARQEADRIRREADQYRKGVKEKMTDLYSTYRGLQSLMGALGDDAG